MSISMAAALKAERAVPLATRVAAIELLCASQAIDPLAPRRTSPPLHARIRASVPRLERDRLPSPDIEAIARLIAEASLEAACPGEVK